MNKFALNLGIKRGNAAKRLLDVATFKRPIQTQKILKGLTSDANTFQTFKTQDLNKLRSNILNIRRLDQDVKGLNSKIDKMKFGDITKDNISSVLRSTHGATPGSNKWNGLINSQNNTNKEIGNIKKIIDAKSNIISATKPLIGADLNNVINTRDNEIAKSIALDTGIGVAGYLGHKAYKNKKSEDDSMKKIANQQYDLLISKLAGEMIEGIQKEAGSLTPEEKQESRKIWGELAEINTGHDMPLGHRFKQGAKEVGGWAAGAVGGGAVGAGVGALASKLTKGNVGGGAALGAVLGSAPGMIAGQYMASKPEYDRRGQALKDSIVNNGGDLNKYLNEKGNFKGLGFLPGIAKDIVISKRNQDIAKQAYEVYSECDTAKEAALEVLAEVQFKKQAAIEVLAHLGYEVEKEAGVRGIVNAAKDVKYNANMKKKMTELADEALRTGNRSYKDIASSGIKEFGNAKNFSKAILNKEVKDTGKAAVGALAVGGAGAAIGRAALKGQEKAAAEATDYYNECEIAKQAAIEVLSEANIKKQAALEVLTHLGYQIEN